MLLLTGLFVFDHLDHLVLAPRTFKGAPIMVWFVRLDENEPHLRIANFAGGTADYSRMQNDLNFSHDSPYFAANRSSAP
jgi:hypothetical protein